MVSQFAPVYLDYNATSPLLPAVKEAMVAALEQTGNPSSVHAFGRQARRLVDDAREIIASRLDAAASDVIFTGSGTESNVTALRAFPDRPVLISAIEHDSVLNAVPAVERIRVTRDGVIDLDHLEFLLKQCDRPALVSVMAVNNETGVIQPLTDVVAVARRYKALVHTDAVQAVGRIPVSFRGWDVDMMTVSAHKLGGPPGVGALIARGNLPLVPLLPGGGQERRRRSGTENVPGIVGFGVAVKHIDLAAYAAALVPLRDRLESAVRVLNPAVTVHGQGAPRVANTTSISMPRAVSQTLLMAFDLAGIAISAGSACSSGKVQSSHVLKAMGVPDSEAAGALRISLGWQTTPQDIDRFIQACESVLRTGT